MFYVVVGNTAFEWSELAASVVGYMLIVGVGLILALAVDIVCYFLRGKGSKI